MKLSFFSRLFASPQVKRGAKKDDHTTPHLTRKAEFIEALKDYKMNPGAAQLLADTPLVVLNGPTGTGRNTVIRELVKTGHYHFVVSDTTRPPRYNDGVMEQNGVEYFFCSEENVLDNIRRGDYVEAELIHDQQVSGQSIREIKRAHDEGKIALNEIEIQGILEMLRKKPDTVAFLLLPPSFEVWLQRVRGRNAVDQVELNRRLETAVTIFTTALEQDVFNFVINDDLATAVKAIDDIGRLHERHPHAEERARTLARTLREQTIAYLAAHS